MMSGPVGRGSARVDSARKEWCPVIVGAGAVVNEETSGICKGGRCAGQGDPVRRKGHEAEESRCKSVFRER